MAKRDEGLLAEIERGVLEGLPVADTLRKCVILGGRLDSVELRDWAARELRGYEADDEVPAYRTVGASILADAVTGNAIVTGQRIAPSSLPEFAQDLIKERYTFGIGVGELEALVQQAKTSGGSVELSLPMAADLAEFMDNELGDPFQKITALYWQVSVSSVEGVLDQVKTTVAELIAELRVATPEGSELPGREAAAQAVNVIAHKKARVTVTNAQSGSGAATADSAPAALEPDSGFWTKSRKIGALLVGLAAVASAVLGGFQVYGSPF